MLQKQFEEEEEKTKEFLEKLNQISKVSKNIKQKNIHSIQRQEWTKEYLQLMKNERILTLDLEQKLILLEMNSDLPKFYLAALHEQGQQNYKQVKEELIYQLQNLKRVSTQLNQSKQDKIVNKKTGNSQFNDLMFTFKDYLHQIVQKLEQEYLQECQLVDEENEDTLDMQQCNVQICNSFIKKIEQEYQNDKLISYSENCNDPEELEILQNYGNALDFLYQRYQLEIKKLLPKNRLEINEEMLYLASSNSLHSMQRLMLHYPKLNRTQLQEVVDYVRKQKDINKRLIILQKQWKIEYSQLQNKSESLLSELQKDKIDKNQRWLNYLTLKQYRMQLFEELEEKRTEYEKKQEILQQSIDEQKQQQELIEQEKHREWLEHKAEIGLKAQEFQQIKEQKRLDFINQQQQEAEQQKQLQMQQIEQAKPKVNQRQEKEIIKIKDKIIKKEIKRQEPEIRAQRISEAINKYSIRPNVEKDFQRVISETETRQLRKQTKYDKADKIPLSNVTGFNINQLMSDMRYRIQVALNDAGLANTQYAREVILNMSKPNQG